MPLDLFRKPTGTVWTMLVGYQLMNIPVLKIGNPVKKKYTKVIWMLFFSIQFKTVTPWDGRFLTVGAYVEHIW